MKKIYLCLLLIGIASASYGADERTTTRSARSARGVATSSATASNAGMSRSSATNAPMGRSARGVASKAGGVSASSAGRSGRSGKGTGGGIATVANPAETSCKEKGGVWDNVAYTCNCPYGTTLSASGCITEKQKKKEEKKEAKENKNNNADLLACQSSLTDTTNQFNLAMTKLTGCEKSLASAPTAHELINAREEREKIKYALKICEDKLASSVPGGMSMTDCDISLSKTKTELTTCLNDLSKNTQFQLPNDLHEKNCEAIMMKLVAREKAFADCETDRQKNIFERDEKIKHLENELLIGKGNSDLNIELNNMKVELEKTREQEVMWKANYEQFYSLYHEARERIFDCEDITLPKKHEELGLARSDLAKCQSELSLGKGNSENVANLEIKLSQLQTELTTALNAKSTAEIGKANADSALANANKENAKLKCDVKKGSFNTSTLSCSCLTGTVEHNGICKNTNEIKCIGSGGGWSFNSQCYCPTGRTLTNGECKLPTVSTATSMSTFQMSPQNSILMRAK